MKYTVEKAVEITLKLSQEEFNTLVAGVGATHHGDRSSTAKDIGINILDVHDSADFYSQIKRIAKSL